MPPRRTFGKVVALRDAMTPLVSLLLWLAIAPAVTVEADAACGAADEIGARVTALLPPRSSDAAPDVVRIADRGDAWLVVLAAPDGTTLGERTLGREVPCPDLAAAAAVIIATWESDVHAEFRAAPEPVPTVAAPTIAAPTVVATPRASAAPATRAALELGAGLTGSIAPSADGSAPALGAKVEGTWFRRPRGLGAGLALTVPATRDLPLGSGVVRWRRLSAAAGPVGRWLSSTTRWALDVHGEALVGWVTATGEGFASDRGGSGLDAGLGAGIRLIWLGTRRAAPWLELGGTGWLRRQDAYATPDGRAVELPRVELGLALGLSFRALP